MTKRRIFLDKFKAAVALEALRGDKTVREIAAYLPQSVFSAGRPRVRRLMGINGCTRSRKRPTQARSIHSPRSGHTCCESWRSRVLTKSGTAISRKSPLRTACCIWWRSWIGRHARYCPGGCRTRWMPASVLGRWRRLSQSMENWK